MHRVRFHPTGRVVRVPPGTTLLVAARAAGLPLARGCNGAALCGRCGLRVLAGEASLEPESREETSAKARGRVAQELRLACCARIDGHVEVTTTYW